MLEWLRPAPFRGDVIAAGAIPLAAGAILIELRMTQWAVGPRLIVVGVVAALILTMGWLAPMEGPSPRAYHSMLLITGLIVLAVALQLLAEALGSSRPPGAGADFWTLGVVCAVAAACARRANSAVCTLIAALAGGIALEGLVGWLLAPISLNAVRWVLLALTFGFGVGALRLRDGQRRHAVALVNAAGLATLVLALTLVIESSIATVVSRLGAPAIGARAGGASFGWKLWILAIGFGLIAYAGSDREPGPAYIGVVVVLAFIQLAAFSPSGRGSIVGWPLFLLVVGGAGLVLGLRPTTPAPPRPTTPLAETIPLREDDEA